VLAGLTTNFTELYLTRIVLGIAEAPFFVIAGSLTRRYFSADSRGLASSVVNIGPKIANGFAPPLVAFLIIYFSWRGMFITLGIFGMLIVVLWRLIYLKDDSAWLPADNVATNLIPITHKFSFKELFFNKTIVWFNLGNFGSSYVFWLFFTWIPTYLMDQRGLNLKETGFLTMIPFLAGVIAVPLGGWVSDRLIKNGWNVIKARLVPAVGGCLIAGLASFPINYVDSLSVAIILFTISTFAVSARVGVMWALVGDISPKEIVGTVGGIQNFANFIGGALAPMITGFVLAKTGNYNIVFWISGILVILAAFCYAMIKTPILAKS
jgi:MFS family permease